MKSRKRNNRIRNRKTARKSTERRLGSEPLEGRLLMAADMGWWSLDNQTDEQAEEKTDSSSSEKATSSLKSKKQSISFSNKKQATLSSRQAKRPTVSLPSKLRLAASKNLELRNQELLEAQEMQELGGGFDEISASKGTTEFDELLKEVGIARNSVIANDLFGDFEGKMAEGSGSLESRLESLVSAPGSSTSLGDARSAIEQARGMASQPTTDSNGNTWFETKSADGSKTVLISPDRKLPGETGNGGTIIVVQHTDDGTTITITSNHNGKVQKSTVKCNDDGCSATTTEDNNNNNNNNNNNTTNKPTGKTGQPAPDDAGSEGPLPATLVREAWTTFYAQHGAQPWNSHAGQPVPESDGEVGIDPAAASHLFSQLARQKWNPMIGQPGPDGDNEQDYLAMKEPSSNIGFIKLSMAGQPVPDDPDWGDNNGPSEGVSGGNVTPQPVTTQTPTAADEAGEEEEVPEQDH